MRIGFVYKDALGSGGYPRDIRWLASAVASYGISLTLFTELGSVTEGLIDSIRVEPLESVGRVEVDLYHFFGIFIPSHLWLIRRVLDKKIVVSPLGHLMPYHLQKKRLKKRLYLQMIKPLLKKVKWFHVFSSREKSFVREYLGNNILSFEASLGVFPVPVAAAQIERMEKERTSSMSLLFFGRNDVYQKGIDILLEGFARAVRNGINIRLTIAGRPWMDSERYIGSFIKKHGLRDMVRVLGPIDEVTKYSLIQQADYLVFLSRWDGPPRPIREAIAVGTPVIVSPETNMGDLVEKYEAGLQVQLNAEEVCIAISKVAADAKLRKYHRGKIIELRKVLDWRNVAQDYIQGYEQIIARK
jgi:glycosyltransferase involved in cell wall biosynthesis